MKEEPTISQSQPFKRKRKKDNKVKSRRQLLLLLNLLLLLLENPQVQHRILLGVVEVRKQ
jgi:hypothetical protein